MKICGSWSPAFPGGALRKLRQTEPYLAGQVESVSCPESGSGPRSQALRREANSLYAAYTEYTEHPAQLIQLKMLASDDDGFLADSIGQNSGLDIQDKAALLAQLNPTKRLEMAVAMLRREIEVLKLESEIQDKTRVNMDQNQRDYYLREQMRAIREELGEEDENAELDEDIARIKKLHLAEEQEKKLIKDAEQLKKQPFGSSEAAVLRNYLDTVLELPWNVEDQGAGGRGRCPQDSGPGPLRPGKGEGADPGDHGRPADGPGRCQRQILCLVGPPGVGKTSIAYSIARCLNRKMARISLGGVHDEADIRGHRKTYVGAMPGRIMTAMTQAGQLQSRCCCWTRSTKWAPTTGAIPARLCWRCWTRSRTAPTGTIIWRSPLTCPTCCLSPPPTPLDTVPRPAAGPDGDH